jgi:hypothetical protein
VAARGRPGSDFVVGDELRFGDVHVHAELESHTTILVMGKPKRALSVETVAFGGVSDSARPVSTDDRDYRS